MFRLDLGSSGRYCDGLNRRSFLQLGVAGMASVGLPGCSVPAQASRGQPRRQEEHVGHPDLARRRPRATWTCTT